VKLNHASVKFKKKKKKPLIRWPLFYDDGLYDRCRLDVVLSLSVGSDLPRSLIVARAALRPRLVRIRRIPGFDGDKRGTQTETRAGEFIVAAPGEGASLIPPGSIVASRSIGYTKQAAMRRIPADSTAGFFFSLLSSSDCALGAELELTTGIEIVEKRLLYFALRT